MMASVFGVAFEQAWPKLFRGKKIPSGGGG